MNNRQENQDKIIQELKLDINSSKVTNGEQNNLIQEKDWKLAENARLIQANEPAINEKNKQIQAKDATNKKKVKQLQVHMI